MGKIDKTTVKELNLEKFLGTWYEIARFQHSFEKDLVGVTATYSLKKNGRIEVLNQGYQYKLDGVHKKATGKAKQPDPVNKPGQLKVSFFLFFYAEYNILELDSENYQWALIGSNTPGYLWILCRKPVMDEELYKQLVEKARQRGYNVENLVKVEQKHQL
ncbi:MAG: lipocalin [Bacteroidetes bacterium GWF2_38_335]|nr:MAG: lipocalin [Bacteroidetes bacterium GWF2_38_335]OFY77301.1 MAG: lipocalin [Bacteroidetes bacterium RIFOXYA12_FULL_38_20]HBS85794.1 lipocalin [Bacteroidales bacterium]